jgi:DDE superfamily endonuclease
VGADFAWRMEDVLDLYAEPADPARPRVCFDERPVILHRDAHPSAPCVPGLPQRVDYEYVREGTCNCLLTFLPDTGERHVDVTAQRAAQDFARAMRWLAEERYPDAVVIRVVLDNLSTHTPAAFYQSFDAETARRLTQRLEFHYTPKHASWLNMAELELAVLERQCLDRRLPTPARVATEVAAWEAARNATRASVTWRFSTSAARTRLARHYPQPA